MENWQVILYDTMRADINKLLIVVYYISWSFIGNFILLNLFLAILIDSFLEEKDEEDEEKHKEELKNEDADKKKKKNSKKKQKQKKKEKSKESEVEENKSGDSNEDNDDFDDMDEGEKMKIFAQTGLAKGDKAT